MKRYTAVVDNTVEMVELLETAKKVSEKEHIIYVMSNGYVAQILHSDYVDESKEDGFWTATIFEDGYRVDN